MIIDKEKAKEIVTQLWAKGQSRFKQDLAGENEELLDRGLRQYRAKAARSSWRVAQKWCKWNSEGPVLMPDFTRIYYRKGDTEVLLQEFAPQVRLMRFKGSLAKRESTEDKIEAALAGQTFQYSLALPYVVFIFRFIEGTFNEVKCAFSDRPLKRLEERPLRPFLSNIDNTLKVCLGRDFDENQLQRGNLTQQSAFVLNHFWQSVYSDEWSQHFWNYKSHFRQNETTQMASLEAWQDHGIENPLFVIEGVDWLKHTEESFGDMIVRLMETDKTNTQFSEEMYKDLTENFVEEVKKTMSDNFATTDNRIKDQLIDQLADELITLLSQN